jgi:hypothetical protein
MAENLKQKLHIMASLLQMVYTSIYLNVKFYIHVGELLEY